MSVRRAAILFALICSLIAPAAASASYSEGTPGQIAWVRRAATNFLTAELSGNGSGACAILNAPLRGTRHGRSCQERWDAKLAVMLRSSATRRRLKAQRHQVATAGVIVHGKVAALHLKTPLLNGPNHFLWTENCWMLEG
jgi:hypothetical protein